MFSFLVFCVEFTSASTKCNAHHAAISAYVMRFYFVECRLTTLDAPQPCAHVHILEDSLSRPQNAQNNALKSISMHINYLRDVSSLLYHVSTHVVPTTPTTTTPTTQFSLSLQFTSQPIKNSSLHLTRREYKCDT